MFTPFDTRMMARALQLARRGRYSAMPNPHVGCVLTRDETVIGEGFTQPAGGDHAEIQALKAAGNAAGATAYVTLEPCSHQGKTGPCADALLRAGVARVVAAMRDPNPEVAGAGLARLEAAGVEVSCGLLQVEAAALIPGFIARMERGRGRVRAKLAMSLDGRTAMASGESQWITGPAARADVQRLRAESCAIITGIGTVLADDASLTVRADELGLPPEEAARAAARQPLRVVLDSNAQTPPTAKILNNTAPTLLCQAQKTGTDTNLKKGTDTIFLPRVGEGLALAPLMAELAKRQCNEILVESGPRLAGAMLQAGLLDELVLYIAPTLLGDLARPLLHLPLERMVDQQRLTVVDTRQIGPDWRLVLRPEKGK